MGWVVFEFLLKGLHSFHNQFVSFQAFDVFFDVHDSWDNHVNGGVFFPTQLIGHQLDWLEESQELVDQSPVFPLEFEFFIPLA